MFLPKPSPLPSQSILVALKTLAEEKAYKHLVNYSMRTNEIPKGLGITNMARVFTLFYGGVLSGFSAALSPFKPLNQHFRIQR